MTADPTWTEKFDRWWVNYSETTSEQTDAVAFLRNVRAICRSAFMAGAAAEKGEFGNRLAEWFKVERERAAARAPLHAEHDAEYDG